MRDTIDMAREAGFTVGPSRDGPDDVWGVGSNLERLVALVRADERDKWMERTAILIRGEREACAKVCEGWDFLPGGHEFTSQQLVKNLTETIAHHIRARGETK